MRSGFRRTHDVFSWRGAGVPKRMRSLRAGSGPEAGWLLPIGELQHILLGRRATGRLLLISRYLPNLNSASPASIRTSRSERARPPTAAEQRERGASHFLLW